MKKQTVSSKVSQFISEWDKVGFGENNNIYIEAGVGVGKSHFIKNELYNYAKERGQHILFLIHRANCVEQFKNEIKAEGKDDYIEIMTYQKVGSKISIDNFENIFLIDKSFFKWIVADEAHYFCSDAEFNSGTTADLNFILNYNRATKIFMSATGEIFLRYCKSQKFKLKKYKMPINYKYINNLNFFYENDFDAIQNKIDECIAENKKCIFFVQKISKMIEYYNKYKDISAFNCSTSNVDYADILNQSINQERLKHIKNEQKLSDDTQFLFTTTAMDAGVNINNSDLHEIFIDVYDIDTIKQCMGRKRLQSSTDYINLTIRAYGNKSIAQKKLNFEKGIKVVENFEKFGAEAYKEFNKYNQDSFKMIIDSDTAKHGKAINTLKYIKYLAEIERIEKMQEYDKHGYIKFIAKELKYKGWTLLKSDEGGEVMEENENDLEMYLESLVGKKLDKNAQEELINKIDHKVNRRQVKSYTGLNEGLKLIELPYVIDSKRYRENGKLNTVWIIGKITFDVIA